jgi:hypothetical protein
VTIVSASTSVTEHVDNCICPVKSDFSIDRIIPTLRATRARTSFGSDTCAMFSQLGEPEQNHHGS